jgi:hypothetical protein
MRHLTREEQTFVSRYPGPQVHAVSLASREDDSLLNFADEALLGGADPIGDLRRRSASSSSPQGDHETVGANNVTQGLLPEAAVGC